MMNNFFKIEKHRKKLASKKKYKELVKTYSEKYPELKNINSGEFWDKLNSNNWNFIRDNLMDNHRIKLVKKFIPNKQLNILNIGFGSASLEKRILPDRKYNWHGIDLSKKSVSRAKKLFNKSKFSVGNATQLKYKDNYFDYVILLEVLEHIQPSKTFFTFKEIKRVLTQKGRIIVSVPLNEGLKEMIKNKINPNGHLRDYSIDLIKAELEISGFNVDKEFILYAFNNLYLIKSLIVKFKKNMKPNNIVILAQKK